MSDDYVLAPVTVTGPRTIPYMNSCLYVKLTEFVDNLQNETLKHIFPSQYLLDICADETDKVRLSASSLKMAKAQVAETDDPVHFKWEFMGSLKWKSVVDSLKLYLKK